MKFLLFIFRHQEVKIGEFVIETQERSSLLYYLNLLLQMWTDVEVFAPFNHALENADQTFETFGSNSPKLIGRRTDLKGLTTPGNL